MVTWSGSGGPSLIGDDNRYKSFNTVSCVDIGASHINLALVYDLYDTDFLDFLYAINYELASRSHQVLDGPDRCSDNLTYAVTVL
jgi:hypothetical protein